MANLHPSENITPNFLCIAILHPFDTLLIVTEHIFFTVYVLLLLNELKRKLSLDSDNTMKFEQSLFDDFVYALVKGDFVMQVAEKSEDIVDKWGYNKPSWRHILATVML